MPTAGQLRSRAEQLEDELIKERVIRGIALLEAHVGPDWPNRVDPAVLLLSSPRMCILGQVFDPDVELTDGQLARLVKAGEEYEDEGFSRGLVILNGDVQENPHLYAFERDGDYDYPELQAAWTALWE